MKKIFIIIFLILNLDFNYSQAKEDIYKKIDLFGEVLENIKKDYVDEVDQSEMMDSAINGVLQSLDPYSAYIEALSYSRKCKLILVVNSADLELKLV